MSIKKLVRPELLKVQTYHSSRNEDNFESEIWLDSNENPFLPFGTNERYNRYGDPRARKIKDKLVTIFDVKSDEILITLGADNAIELVIRTFCVPYQDSIVVTSPTFSCYNLYAEVNSIKTIDIPLLKTNYQPDWEKLKKQKAKVFFICNPSNPVGNIIPLKDIKNFAKSVKKSIVVVDEAYIDFSDSTSSTTLLKECKNIVVLKTLSKSYSLAGIRMGISIADKDIIEFFDKVIAPYPIPQPCIDIASKVLSPTGLLYVKNNIEIIKKERERLNIHFKKCKEIKHIFPSSTNFILLKVEDADKFYNKLKQYGVIVKKQSNIKDAIRIAIGSPKENDILLSILGLIPFQKAVREATINRSTKETQISCNVKLDGKGISKINTSIGFFDHILDQIAKHSGISLTIFGNGDLHIDTHHLIEDVSITLGQALKKAAGDKKGINRYACFSLVMDEAKADVELDLSGRSYLTFDVDFTDKDAVMGFPNDMVKHFFDSLSSNLGATMNIKAEGYNTHHIIECIFKCFAKVLKDAVAITSDKLPSTKGLL